MRSRVRCLHTVIVLTSGPAAAAIDRRPLGDAMDEFAEITQHLLRFSPDALIVIDARGVIRFANDTVTEMFGYPREQLLGKPLDVLVPERLRARHGDHLAAFMRAPSSREMGARSADLYARRLDGSEFSAGIRLAPFHIKDKLFVAAAIRDNSERQRINEELVQARIDADQANRAKSRFLATASHDLRQPLQTIRLLNAAMLRLATDSEIAELLKHQRQAIETTTRLLNALLDISRLESGAITPQMSRMFLPEMFDELRSEFESLARTRGLTLSMQAARVTLLTDRVLFSQLMQNLVGNAIKYTDEGGVTIDCSLESDRLVIAVRDTGIGIPPDKLERIFDEYYQVDTHGAKRLGVGLGLAIVKEVARLLNFRIEIDSVVGRSTEVFITVPAQALAETEVPASSTITPNGEVATSNKTRVLLVEDNEGVRKATELFLKLEGLDVRSAGSFAAANEMIDTLTADEVIIADYHLDGAHTGLEVLQRARTRHAREVPGVILSGDLPSLVRSVSTPIAVTKFLSKPVDTDALLLAIKELSSAALERGAQAAKSRTAAS